MTDRERSQPTEIQVHLKRHLDTSDHYYSNALKLLKKRDHRKAAEMFWGAASQMVKALGVVADNEPQTHGEIRKFIFDGPAQAEPHLMELFREIESLHSHFYEARLEPEEVESIAAKTTEFISWTRELLYREIGPPPTIDELAGTTSYRLQE